MGYMSPCKQFKTSIMNKNEYYTHIFAATSCLGSFLFSASFVLTFASNIIVFRDLVPLLMNMLVVKAPSLTL